MTTHPDPAPDAALDQTAQREAVEIVARAASKAFMQEIGAKPSEHHVKPVFYIQPAWTAAAEAAVAALSNAGLLVEKGSVQINIDDAVDLVECADDFQSHDPYFYGRWGYQGARDRVKVVLEKLKEKK